MAYEFLFDTNKCTGCHACAVACIIENQVDIEYSWRQIVSYNADHYPGLPRFHLSLACNQCNDAPCLKYCPANAYSKDNQTGSVVLNSDFCIGCKYCTWVCPYDAPKFNRKTGTVEKCTFCLHRLQKSKEPACVALCPTDALDIRERIKNETNQEQIPGFRDYGISPGIKIIQLEQDRQQPEMYPSEYICSEILDLFKNQQLEKSPKMNVKSEWTLLLLSLIFPFLIALLSVFVVQKSENDLIPIIIGCGIISLGMSTLHLGNKKRAYRAVFNIKNSWLSREILFLSLFLLALITQFVVADDTIVLKLAILLFGILALFSMDKVYTVIPNTKPEIINSSMVVLSAVYWYGILSMNFYVIGLCGCLRIYLYLSHEHKNFFTPLIRLISGYFIPVLLLLSGNLHILPLIIAVVFIGEIIDRYEFYKSFDIVTPFRQMQLDEQLYYNSHALYKLKEVQ